MGRVPYPDRAGGEATSAPPGLNAHGEARRPPAGVTEGNTRPRRLATRSIDLLGCSRTKARVGVGSPRSWPRGAAGEACPAPRPSVGFVGPRGLGPRGGFFSIRMSVSHDTQASKTRRRRRTSPLAGCRPAASDAVRDEGVASAWRQISHDHERVPSRWMHRGPPGPRGGSSRCEGPIGASRDAPGPRDTDRGHVGPAPA
jgi:hypothetical protein